MSCQWVGRILLIMCLQVAVLAAGRMALAGNPEARAFLEKKGFTLTEERSGEHKYELHTKDYKAIAVLNTKNKAPLLVVLNLPAVWKEELQIAKDSKSYKRYLLVQSMIYDRNMRLARQMDWLNELLQLVSDGQIGYSVLDDEMGKVLQLTRQIAKELDIKKTFAQATPEQQQAVFKMGSTGFKKGPYEALAQQGRPYTLTILLLKR